MNKQINNIPYQSAYVVIKNNLEYNYFFCLNPILV